jgi:hypothetical protein
MSFCIGDRVRIIAYDKLPEGIKNKGLAKNAGNEGEIVDIMYSSAKGCDVYRIRFDGFDRPSKTDFPEGSFDLVSELEAPKYSYEFEYLENLVVARLYEVTEDSKTEVAKGHGHIFHDGVIGIAQAASYALKKIYLKLEGEE